MKTKSLLLLLVCLLIGIAIVHLLRQGDTDSTTNQQSNVATASVDIATGQPLQVTDYSGQTIQLNKTAKRIIALAPHIVENVYSAGAGDLLKGVVTYSNYPPAAKNLPIVGGYNIIDYERIVELNPDLIIAWNSGHSKNSIERLQELGFNVYIDQPQQLEDVAKSIRDIGLLAGQIQHANKSADDFLEQLTQLRHTYAHQSKISTLYQVWDSPLQTINGQHIISDAIELCGGQNIYADAPAIAPIINIESVLDRNPQAIIASGMANERPDWLDDWRRWPQLHAVQQENLLFVKPDHIQRHAVRILLGIRSICQQLNQVRERTAQ